MLINKLQNITHKVYRSYIFKLIIITLFLLLTAFAMLEHKGGEIEFIYNNF